MTGKVITIERGGEGRETVRYSYRLRAFNTLAQIRMSNVLWRSYFDDNPDDDRQDRIEYDANGEAVESTLWTRFVAWQGTIGDSDQMIVQEYDMAWEPIRGAPPLSVLMDSGMMSGEELNAIIEGKDFFFLSVADNSAAPTDTSNATKSAKKSSRRKRSSSRANSTTSTPA